jgi:hypothetical protein
MQHAMMSLLLGNKLFWCPIDPNPQRVLDLGTGTGPSSIPLSPVKSSLMLLQQAFGQLTSLIYFHLLRYLSTTGTKKDSRKL